MRNMKNKKTLGIIGLSIVAILAGFLIYRDMRKRENTQPATTINGVTMTGNGSVAVEPIGSSTASSTTISGQNLPPPPPLDRSVAPLSTLTPQVVKIVDADMAATIATLKSNPMRIDAWIDLGLQRKELGDYIGARDAWEYAKALGQDTNIVPWNNLGDLYHYYLKDYPKSELNWKKVIALKPDYIQAYRGLFELYFYSYTEKADQIPVFLKAGIAKNPNSPDLKQMLADYEQSLTK